MHIHYTAGICSSSEGKGNVDFHQAHPQLREDFFRTRGDVDKFVSFYKSLITRHKHGHRKRGVGRGSDTPAIYVEGILIMYIPLEKPNT